MMTNKAIPTYFLLLFNTQILELTLCALQKGALTLQGGRVTS